MPLAYFKNVLFDVSFHFIVFDFHAACTCGFVNAEALRALLARTRVGDLILGDDEVASKRFNIKAVSFLGATIVQHFVARESVPMTAVLESLFSEVDA